MMNWTLVALGSFGCCGDVSLIQFDCSVGALVRGQGVLCERRRGATRRRFLLGLYLLVFDRLACSEGFLLGFPIGGIPGRLIRHDRLKFRYLGGPVFLCFLGVTIPLAPLAPLPCL